MTMNDQAAMNEQLMQLRLQGLSIDGDNRYKQDLIDAIIGAMMFGAQDANPPPAGHWLEQFYVIAREERGALARVEAELEKYAGLAADNSLAKVQAQAQLAEAVGLGKALHSACVNLLYGGYDRISELGGDCDPVSKMEAENPAMQEWKAFLARHAQAEQQEAQPARVVMDEWRAEQEAQGAQAGDEDAAFMAWAEREYQTGPDEELNLKHLDVIQNRKGWMARAALATQPAVRGDEHDQ